MRASYGLKTLPKRKIAPRILALLVVLLGLTVLDCSATIAQADETPAAIVRPILLTHVVQDLAKSVRFYHEGLGLDVASPPRPLTSSLLLLKAKATNSHSIAMAATLNLPGATFQLQLIQFTGIEGQPFMQHLYDPGITRLSISVRDIYKVFNQVKDLGVTVNTTTAGPVYTQRPRNNTQAVMLTDPDGFVLEFVQADDGQGPGADVPPGIPADSNIYNARCSLGVENIDQAVTFYRDALGFAIARPPGVASDSVLALEGTPRASARLAPSMPPGSTNMWVLWSFSDIERVARSPNVQDPGASIVTFQVRGLPALLLRLQAAGVRSETLNAASVTLPDRSRAALVRSPDGLLIQFIE